MPVLICLGHSVAYVAHLAYKGKMMKKILFLLSISLLTVTQLFCKTDPNRPYIWTYSDTKGDIKLFWLPNKTWPQGGWRIEKIQNGKTTILAKKIYPASDKNSLSKLPAKKIEQIKKLTKQIKSGKMTREQAAFAKFVFGAQAATDMTIGKTLGLRYDDNSKIKGDRIYKLSALDKNGKVISSVKSKKVNPYKKSPPPQSISKLKANVTIDGVNLMWSKPKLDKINPVVGYKVIRIDSDGSKVTLTDKTLLISQNVFKNKVPIITDKNAPLEKSVTYRVFSVGFFANQSRPKDIKVFIEDLRALMPPEKLSVKAGKESVELKWSKNQSPYCAGYLVERSYLNQGPYTVITPKGLIRNRVSYTDENIKGGTAYYYKIRAINTKGKIGKASYARMAIPVSKSGPPVITGLKADVGVSEIKLKWKKPKVNVAGYLVFRRPTGAKKWSQLNNYVVPDEFYEDSYSSSTYGSFDYRIVTVGNDTQQSKPSRAVHVELIDSISPNPPYITDIDPSNGKVKINFKPAPPINDIDYFLLIRSVSEDDPGLVIGDKIATKKHKVTDNFVKCGQRYWYRLVAVDKSGNRSELSRARTVVVQNPPIPTPKAPRLTYIEKPIPHVEIKVDFIPKQFIAIIYKKGKKGWEYVASTADTIPVNDLKIDKNKVLLYKVQYKAENGVGGTESKRTKIETK